MILLLTLWPFAIIASAWIVVRWATANQPLHHSGQDEADGFRFQGAGGLVHGEDQ